MSTQRPATPAISSDISSDGGSLSDIDSSWTDLETTRSNGRCTPSTTSDAGDSEDARSVTDRYDDGEAWEGLVPPEGYGRDVSDDTFRVEFPSAAASSSPGSSSPVRGPSGLTLEDWVADAIGSSVLDDDETSTPQRSFYSSSTPLRLSFPDPLSNSDRDLLPSHSLPRAHSPSKEEESNEIRVSRSRSGSLSSLAPHSAPATTPTDESFSVSDENEEKGREVLHQTSSNDLDSLPDSYTLSILLLGHPPLPHLKKSALSTVIDMVATVLDGSARAIGETDNTRIQQVFVDSPPSAPSGSTHRLIIVDHTSGMSLPSSFVAHRCPTLALVFIQPPLSSPSLPPSLPPNTRYLPLLLPSVSDCFSASLLDLPQSVVFERSLPDDASTSDAMAMKSFALSQCIEMEIGLGNRLDESREISTIEEFSRTRTDELYARLRDLLFPYAELTKESTEQNDGDFEGSLEPGYKHTLRKQILIISTFLLAIVFGSIVIIRGFPSGPQVASLGQGPTAGSFSPPFIKRIGNSQTSTVPSSSDTPTTSSQPLIPASLKSLAVSVFNPDVVTGYGRTPIKSQLRAEKEMGKRPADVGSKDVDREDRPARHLAIDVPFPKSLSILPETQYTMRTKDKGKGKEVAHDGLTAGHGRACKTITSLCSRVSDALGPVLVRLHTDMREILEAIDALLQAIWRLQQQTAHGLGGFVELVWGRERMQGLADKVQQVAQSMGERASKRHARAKHNAHKLQDMGKQYVRTAGERIQRSIDRARGNARRLKERVARRRSEYRLTWRERKRTRVRRRMWCAECGEVY